MRGTRALKHAGTWPRGRSEESRRTRSRLPPAFSSKGTLGHTHSLPYTDHRSPVKQISQPLPCPGKNITTVLPLGK